MLHCLQKTVASLIFYNLNFLTDIDDFWYTILIAHASIPAWQCIYLMNFTISIVENDAFSRHCQVSKHAIL